MRTDLRATNKLINYVEKHVALFFNGVRISKYINIGEI